MWVKFEKCLKNFFSKNLGRSSSGNASSKAGDGRRLKEMG